MRPIVRAVLLTLAAATPALPQTPIPNPMASHTVFILGLVGAFLAWAASFSFHTMAKTRSKKEDIATLRARRERVLDALAEAETARESGALSPEAWERRHRELRSELARVVAKLGKS